MTRPSRALARTSLAPSGGGSRPPFMTRWYSPLTRNGHNGQPQELLKGPQERTNVSLSNGAWLRKDRHERGHRHWLKRKERKKKDRTHGATAKRDPLKGFPMRGKQGGSERVPDRDIEGQGSHLAQRALCKQQQPVIQTL